jgi:hypothetical protein
VCLKREDDDIVQSQLDCNHGDEWNPRAVLRQALFVAAVRQQQAVEDNARAGRRVMSEKDPNQKFSTETVELNRS